MSEENPYYRLLNAVVDTQTKLLDISTSRPITKEEKKLFWEKNKHLPKNMSLIELLFDNFTNWVNISNEIYFKKRVA